MSLMKESRRIVYGRWFRVQAFVVFYLLVLGVSGCAYQVKISGYGVPGFWDGVLHGFLIFFSFIGSLFSDVRIYAFPNAGVWYDFGYVIGATMFLGGGGAAIA